ncbi:MAG: HlyD family type I secretion periplasmic adaptor subunit [Pseudomonadota bacterium]
MQLPHVMPALPKEGFTLETSDRTPRRIGVALLVIVFGGFGLWALLAPIESAAVASGVVTVKGNRKTVQHLEGGIVSEIRVADGQKVERGETLLILDTTDADAELGILRGQYYTNLAMQNRLMAERDGLTEIAFSDELAVPDDRAVEAMKNEVQIFRARRNDRMGAVEVMDQRIIQLESRIDGLQAQIESKLDIIDSYTEEVADLTELLSQGFVDKQRLRELQRSRSRFVAEVAEHRAAIAQSNVQIGETRLEILQLNNRFTTEVVDLLADAQSAVYDIAERISSIQYRLDRSDILAPESGIVLGMNTHTIGGVIKPGAPLLDIVPEQAELVIDARVAPIDIDNVDLGTEATIRLNAFDFATTPTIEGVLTKISADRLVDEQTGAPYYLARVEVSEEDLAALGLPELVPGMPAEVLLKTGQQTLFQYLAKPAKSVFARSLIEE